MDRKKSIFFICVTLIIIALIYYVVKKFKERTSPSPSPPAQTDELSISDLKFTRTLNPDKSKSNSESEISGYTIEYAGIEYKTLSQNVTFTITWKNNIGFTGAVKGFKIEHFVKGDNGFPTDANLTKNFTSTTTQTVDTSDFGDNSVKIFSNGTYSVVGDNTFKIHVIKNDDTPIKLYDGVEQTDTDTHHINVSEDELGATLDMTTPQSVTYIPVVSSDANTLISAAITKVKYDVSNGSGVKLHSSQLIYLIPAEPGNNNDAETFFLKYSDGQYLLHDLNKGDWNNKTGRTNRCDADCHTTGDFDNRMYIAFYNKSTTTDNNIKVQLRRTNMGYGQGIEFLSTDTSDNLVLVDMSSQTSTVPKAVYNNSFWTFQEALDQICEGGWVLKNTNYDTCQLTRIYQITQEKRGNGKECDYEKGKEEIKPLTSSEIRENIPDNQRQQCKNRWEYSCGSTYAYETIDTDRVTRQACTNGVKATAANTTTTLRCNRNSCPSSGGGVGSQ